MSVAGKTSPFKKLSTLYKTQTKYPVVSVLKLQGVITSAKGGQSLNLEANRKKIDDAFKPDRLAAVLVGVNSPGVGRRG